MNIEEIPIAELDLDPANVRQHDEKNLAAIKSSLKRFGQQKPIVVDPKGIVIAGNGTLTAARALGWDRIRIVRTQLEGSEATAYAIADNRTAELATWDDDALMQQLSALDLEDSALVEAAGFSAAELEGMVDGLLGEKELNEDEVPEVPKDPITKPGDLWILGDHRLLCGDSTKAEDVERLMDGQKAQLMHADPPYGMGKASDGVANDNLYNDKLDSFQMEWWATVRPSLEDNASAYIWGNAPELWRLWYKAGLGSSEQMELRNQIVWDKKFIPGMASPHLTQFPIASEHCLFFQLGEQFRDNVNTEDFPEEWEPLRSYMESEAKAAQIGSTEIKSICGVQMYGHWFTASQFALIPEKHYATLQATYSGRFLRPWRQLKAEWDKVKSIPTQKIQQARTYFDNTHDNMTDVWEFSRVTGEERHGHATPKPVAMMERVMKSSLPSGGLCVEPFGGSGSTLIGAEKTGRCCFSMELNPAYCDVIVGRWENLTGRKAELERREDDDQEKIQSQA